MRSSTLALALLGSSLFAACSDSQPQASASATPATAAAPGASEAVTAAIRAALGGDYEARYFDARADLNGDGQDEILAYVGGSMLCGSGGCNLFVFTPREGALVKIGDVSVARVPVRVAASSSNGWRDLIVHVAGGGAESSDALLKFDGASYPHNPTVAPAERVATLDGSAVLIGEFGNLSEGKPLP